MSPDQAQAVHTVLTHPEVFAVQDAVNLSLMTALQDAGFRMTTVLKGNALGSLKSVEILLDEDYGTRHRRSCWKDPLSGARLLLDCSHKIIAEGVNTSSFSILSVKLSYVNATIPGSARAEEVNQAAYDVVALVPKVIELLGPSGHTEAKREPLGLDVLLPPNFGQQLAKRWLEWELTAEEGWPVHKLALFVEQASRHFCP